MDRKAKRIRFTGFMALIAMSLAGGSALAGGFLDIEFGDSLISTPRQIDNDYWPLNPDGSTNIHSFTYESEADDECVVNSIFVNGGHPYYGDGMKSILGYDVLEVLDIEWIDAECDDIVTDDDITEMTFDWYVQDDWQNIWYMGELSRTFEDECEGFFMLDPDTPTTILEDDECYEGSWEAGVEFGEGDDAVVGEPGIVVPGDFPLGDGESIKNGTYYMQEVAFEAEDMAKILRQHAPLVDYSNCRKVKEWTALEPGGSVEHKWYCADGPGLVLIEGIGGGPTEQEVLVTP